MTAISNIDDIKLSKYMIKKQIIEGYNLVKYIINYIEILLFY